MIEIDVSAAREHLNFIDPEASEFAFASYTEKGREEEGSISERMFGPLDKFLKKMHHYQERFGAIYFSVNEINGKGTATKRDISRVRALFVDLDDPGATLDDLHSFDLKPHRIVETSPGKHQVYWLVDGLEVEEAEGFNRWLVRRFQADKGVWDAARVFRLPGSWHRKEDPFQVRVVHTAKDTQSYTIKDLDAAGVVWAPKAAQAKLIEYTPPEGVDVDSLVKLVIGGDADCWAVWDAEREDFNIGGMDGSRYHMALAHIVGKCRLPIEVYDVLLRRWVHEHPGGDRQDKVNRPGYIAMTWAKCGAGSTLRPNETWEAWRVRREAVLALFEDGQIADDGEPDVTGLEEFLRDASDDALAIRAANKFRGNVRFTPMFGKWHIWDGFKWVEDITNRAKDAVRAFLRDEAGKAQEHARMVEAAAVGAKNDRQRELKGIASKLRTLGNRLRKSSTLKDVMSMFVLENRSGAEVVTDYNLWDRDDHLLATPDGIIDLTNGKLIEDGKKHFCSMTTAVGPAPAGTVPKKWLKVIGQVFNDQETIDFLHRYFGYALTGYTREECFVFGYGNGRNGKGTIAGTVCNVLSGYGKVADADTFTLEGMGQHKTAVASLRGRRFVLSSEIPDGASWNIERIKQLTGGDVIEANFMRQDKFEFMPKLSLMICANDKPSFKAVDNATKARFRFVEFPNTFMGKEDKKLKEALKEEYPAILRWLIEGAMAYIKKGLPYPKVIKHATDTYLDEANTLASWFKDVELGPDEQDNLELPDYWYTTSDLMTSYARYCRASVARPVGKHAFTEFLRGKGYEMKRKQFKYRYKGLPYVWGPFRNLNSNS